MSDHKPGDLFRANATGDKRQVSQMMKRMKSAVHVGTVKHTGTSHGKSNALGHGGRAAQLKARGVPGGVIGMMARAAHAAPGQANYHGSKKKVSTPEKQNLGMAFKKAKKTGFAPKEGDKEMKRKTAKKKAGFSPKEGDKEMKRKASKNDHDADDKMKRKGATCMKCKGAHATSMHHKYAKKKSASK